MAPIKPDQFEYQYDPSSILDTRKKLGLKNQTELADLLGVPINTVSRWESKASIPDANTLAALYSLLASKNQSVNFFRKKPSQIKAQKKRTKLVLAWDFQNLAVKDEYIEAEWVYMKKYLDTFFPATKSSRHLLAYIDAPRMISWDPQGSKQAKDVFKELKFDVHESHYNLDSQLIVDSKNACSNHSKTIFILATKDRDYKNLLRELTKKGVDTYLWSPGEHSSKLRSAIDDNNYIHWDAPYVITTCIDVIRNLKGKMILRSEFSSLCKKKLDKEEIYPPNVGFSTRHPYSSLLRWLERHGIIGVTESPKKPDTISIKLIASS